MGVGLFVGVWVARYLGPSQFGQLNYAIAWVSIFTAVAGLGLDSIVVRELVSEPEGKNTILGSAFCLKLTGGIVVWLLILCGSLLLPAQNSVTQLMVWILSAGMIFQSLDTIELWFQSQVQSIYIVLGKSSTFVLINLIKIYLIHQSASLIAFAWVGLIEVTLNSIGLFTVYRFSGNNLFKWRIYLPRIKQLLHDSYPLIFSGLLIMIYMRLDQIMLSIMKGDQELGFYAAAVRTAEVWYFIPTAIASSTLPSIIEAKNTSEDLFYKRLQNLYLTMSILGYATAIPISLVSTQLTTFLYGEDFRNSGPMLAIIIWAGLFVNLGIARSSFLTATNLTKFHLLTVFLGATINILLNIILIPSLGGVGASISTLIAYWVAAHASCFMQKSLVKSGVMITRSLLLKG
jgi:O-antigen/teichoic acid export membrane protein